MRAGCEAVCSGIQARRQCAEVGVCFGVDQCGWVWQGEEKVMMELPSVLRSAGQHSQDRIGARKEAGQARI